MRQSRRNLGSPTKAPPKHDLLTARIPYTIRVLPNKDKQAYPPPHDVGEDSKRLHPKVETNNTSARLPNVVGARLDHIDIGIMQCSERVSQLSFHMPPRHEES
jgi:hypothetical protein